PIWRRVSPSWRGSDSSARARTANVWAYASLSARIASGKPAIVGIRVSSVRYPRPPPQPPSPTRWGEGGDGGHDLVTRSQPPAVLACSRRTYFWTLPVEVFGSGPNTTCFGTLKRARLARHHSRIDSAVTWAPGFAGSTAHGVSPHRSSGSATTAASITAGWR